MMAPTTVELASEKVTAKAGRLLTSGRVTVVEADARQMHVVVDGDTGTYEVVRRRGGWSCSCPCWGRCSHLMASLLIAGGCRAGAGQ